MNNLVLYDGVCIFCNKFVRFVLKRDKKDLLLFTSQDNQIAAKIGEKYNINFEKLDAIVYVRNFNSKDEELLIATNAVIAIFNDIDSLNIPIFLLKIIPRPIRDFFYHIFSRLRYKITGKYEACPIPEENIRSKFI